MSVVPVSNVRVELAAPPEGVTGFGLNEHEAVAGSSWQDSETGELNPPGDVTVQVELPDEPCKEENVVGVHEMLNNCCTFRAKLVLWTTAPAVPSIRNL